MKTCSLYQLVVILVICSTLYITHVQTKAIEGRIISGTAAAPNQFPYHVLLKKDEYDSVRCGGSIISDSWVLTAAHCTSGFTSLILVFGTIELANDAINMTATQFFIHPKYNATNLNNDVSLIQLPTPLSFSSNIQPITLVTSLQAANGFIGDQAIITGFGLMDDEYLDYSQVLLFAQVQIVKNSICSMEYGSDVVKDSTICAKGANGSNMSICSGDSGGALVWQNVDGSYVQIGINSFVAQDQCTESLPSGYVRLSSYLTYITSVTGINFS